MLQGIGIKILMYNNIVFAKEDDHLPIVHALHLLETEIISWGGYFLGGGGVTVSSILAERRQGSASSSRILREKRTTKVIEEEHRSSLDFYFLCTNSTNITGINTNLG